MHKNLVSLFFLFLFVNANYAQIGGITGSKINAVNHAPIPVGLAEFEPSYNFARSSKQWDDNGDLSSIFSTADSVIIDASFNLRMAYAFTEALEFGCNLGADYSNWSAKFAFYSEDDLGLGIMAGFNMPFGTGIIDKKNRTADQIGTYGMGLIGSYETSQKSSLDFNIQIQNYFQKNAELPISDVFLYLDYGHYIKDFFMLASFSYQVTSFDGFNQNKFTFSPGVSIEMKPEYLIVLNGSFDLFGKNIEQSNGFSIAFTITL